MSKKAVKNLEASLKLDKKKAEQIMEKIIYERTEKIVTAFADEAENGSYQHGAYLLDRVFDKARQKIGIDGGVDGAPIIFMPSALVQKFALDKPIESNIIEAEEVESQSKLKTFKVNG